MELDELYQKYRRNIRVASVSIADAVVLALYVPEAMVDEFQDIMGQRNRNPVSFWKRMDFRNRLRASRSLRDMIGHPDDALEYLGNVYAQFEQEGERLVLRVEERGTIEIEL